MAWYASKIPRAQAMQACPLRFAPARVHIHDEMRTALRKCGGVGGNAARRAADMANEDLAFRPGQLAHGFGQDFDRLVGKVGEIMALPVIARAGREQRVERLLPADEGVGTDDIGNRLSDRAQARQSPFRLPAMSPQ